MSFYRYMKDQFYLVIMNLVGGLIVTLYLITIGNSNSQILIIVFGWVIVLTCYLLIDYYKTNKRYNMWKKAFDALDKKYLIAELLKKPNQYTEKLFYDFLRKANKSMMEEINRFKIKEKEYEEFIERWVHEMKTPISAISLICANNRSESTRKIEHELTKMNNLVLQTLFYAKSEFVHQDLFINKVDLNEVIHHVIMENKFLLQEHKFEINIDDHLPTVRSDKKWLTYIINQIILNSIKYSNKETPSLKIRSSVFDHKIVLIIDDNGMGISKSDLPRVFEKGFTGENRNKQHTGLGLYLCKNLCKKLNIDLSIESELDLYTSVTLKFSLTKL